MPYEKRIVLDPGSRSNDATLPNDRGERRMSGRDVRARGELRFEDDTEDEEEEEVPFPPFSPLTIDSMLAICLSRPFGFAASSLSMSLSLSLFLSLLVGFWASSCDIIFQRGGQGVGLSVGD